MNPVGRPASGSLMTTFRSSSALAKHFLILTSIPRANRPLLASWGQSGVLNLETTLADFGTHSFIPFKLYRARSDYSWWHRLSVRRPPALRARDSPAKFNCINCVFFVGQHQWDVSFRQEQSSSNRDNLSRFHYLNCSDVAPQLYFFVIACIPPYMTMML